MIFKNIKEVTAKGNGFAQIKTAPPQGGSGVCRKGGSESCPPESLDKLTRTIRQSALLLAKTLVSAALIQSAGTAYERNEAVKRAAGDLEAYREEEEEEKRKNGTEREA